jgi:hypothetical protein
MKKLYSLRIQCFIFLQRISCLNTRLQALKRSNYAKKRPNKKRSLLLGLPSENEDGALFISPSKVQQARDLISQKNEEAAQEQARKDDKKLQQQLIKQAKELKSGKKNVNSDNKRLRKSNALRMSKNWLN